MKFTVLFLTLLATIAPLAAHAHYEAGVADLVPSFNPQPDTALAFVGLSPETTTFHLLPQPKGFRPLQRCGGNYMLSDRPHTLFPNDVFSLVSKSCGVVDEATLGHAHPGAQIWAEIMSVSGPAGASFGFWEAGRDVEADTPTLSFTSNTSFAVFRFPLSEGPDIANEDPQGHIHGRSWTVTQPGEYRVGIRLVDLSTNGPGELPWHAPSRIYYFRFLAGPDFQTSVTRESKRVRVTWPSQMGIWDAANQVGIDFTILRSTSLASATWQAIGTVTGTTAATASFLDSSPPAQRAFYRLSYAWGWNEENQ